MDSGVRGYITLITTLISANFHNAYQKTAWILIALLFLGTWVCIHAYGSVLISSVSREGGRRTYLSLEEKRMRSISSTIFFLVVVVVLVKK